MSTSSGPDPRPMADPLAQTITGAGATAQTISVGPGGGTSLSSAGHDAELAQALASLPSYAIETKLGEGGMGAVYRAKQRALNRTVAVKVLPQRLSDNAMYVARLNREAIVLAKINHPNVIACYDLGEHQGMRYVVMEFVEGQTLGHLVEERKFLPEKEALYYLKQAVLGLDCANALGIIHRDVKPENMLLSKAHASGTTTRMMPGGFTLKIADLGLATFTTEEAENTRLTTEGSALGSPHYMSPEQTMGESDLDFRTDIYALGITLYHMVTGKTPYNAPTVGAVLAKKLSETIPDPRNDRPELSPSVSALIQKMTARKKADRYATYGDLLHDIEAIEHGKQLSAPALADGSSSIRLLPETLQALKAAPGAAAQRGGIGATPAVVESKKGPVALILIGAVALVALGAPFVLYMSSAKPPSPIPAPPVNTVVTAPLSPPKKLPEPPEKAPAEKTPPPVTETFATQLLIEDRSTKAWTYKGDAKDFGFQDGALFLQSLKQEFNRAERALPGAEYVLRALVQTPTDTDYCELQLGIGDKDYIAFGIRLQPGANIVTVYVERREAGSNKLLESLGTRGDLALDDWQDLKVNVWDRQATCFVATKCLVSAELSEAAAKSRLLRLAVRNGIGQFRNLEVSPRPAK